jgi:hypothetical protein
LVNIDSGNGTRGMGCHCTGPSAPPAALGLLCDNQRACCHFSTVPRYCSDRPVSLHFSLRSSPAWLVWDIEQDRKRVNRDAA